MLDRLAPFIDRSKHFLRKSLPLLLFLVPFLILYQFYPDSYEMTWKGRTFYLFFLWLVALEAILNWDKIPEPKVNRLKSVRTAVFIVLAALPVLYVVAGNYWGLNSAILDFSRQNGISPGVLGFMPLSIEYLVLSVFFAALVSVYYGPRQLAVFSISTLFLILVGFVYIIDNLYPWGRFTPFQIFVPATTMLAASFLNIMGYVTSMSYVENDPTYGSLTQLGVVDGQGRTATFNIAWPCSGVESLLIYSVTILLFLKSSSISWKQRIAYFVFGAVVTYVINAFRIVTIFLIALAGGEISPFHNYYGQLYSISWIISYPLIILASRAAWGRLRKRKAIVESTPSVQPNVLSRTRSRINRFRLFRQVPASSGFASSPRAEQQHLQH